ncbi:MAG: metallophosphoesterase [Clostridia bacterium]|nr:metallophosphoesterase [Clostridia bacterium]
MKKNDKTAKKSNTAAEQKPQKRKNRRFLRCILYILICLLALALLAGGAVYLYSQYTKTHYEITFYQETSKKVSQNIRLIVIADIHNREYGENNEDLISDIRSLKPDLILFAGDMVIKAEDDYQSMLNLVSNLTPIAPCYGIMGNHEDERIYLKNDKDLPERFEKAGLNILRNAQKTIQIGPDKIQLLGISSTTRSGFEEYGARKFMNTTLLDPSAYSIVMAHVPILFDAQLSDYDFDLGIAGHVHGGIVNIPLLGGLYSEEEGFFPTYYGGRNILSNQKPLIISRGLGDSSPIPRINNMPELVVIDVNWY